MNQANVTEANDSRIAEVMDDVLSKIARGESVDVDEYVRRHPEAADILKNALPALRAMANQGSQPTSVNDEQDLRAEKQLGDFRIVRELGRGGMGVVYEADQISLARKVALKVLPFVGVVNEQALLRFRNEVRAAASLDHPNIVSVYSVGEERGVHHYAMQLVRGQTLAEVIAQLAGISGRDTPLTGESINKIASNKVLNGMSTGTDPTEARPASATSAASTHVDPRAGRETALDSGHDRHYYRSVALLAIQAAKALQHAHDRGILHRDIKPGNLMLDAESQLYITDFGLARIESDAAMTMTGDLVGTLRYMSPEQALAKRVVIDQRSDVYSLGATLYELLVLRPVFDATDRQELLKQIAFEDPIQLRKIDRSIPADLETIVLTAIAKNPEERYASAEAFAEDLRAFVDDRPIHAKRPTLTQRTLKWTRRHRPLVNSVIATLAAAIVVGGVLLWNESSKTVAALAEANTQRQLAKTRAEQAQTSEAAALRQRDRARWNQYCAEVVSGQADQQQGQTTRLERKLLRHLPISGQQDHRGWEWYYLFSLCHPEVRTLESAGNSATWSPDGAYVAACGLIYDAETGSCVRRLVPSRQKRVRGKWSPDGTMYAWGTTYDDGCIYIWSRSSDDLAELRWGGADGSVWCLDWSPDGKYLAAGGINHDVWVWDVAAREPIRILEAGSFVTGVAWSPDGELLAAGIKWSQLKVWNARTGELVAHREELEQRGDKYGVNLSWHPDGEHLAVATPQSWLMLRRSDWSVSYQHDQEPGRASGFAVAWRPDGNRLAYANDGTITILDPWNDNVAEVVYEHVGHWGHIAWSPDASRLLTSNGGRNSRMKIWELDSPLQPPVIPARATLQSLSWLPDSDTLAGIDAVDRSVSMWRVDNGERLEVEHEPVPNSAIWSPDRRFAAVLLSETPQRIEVLDLALGSVRSIWKSRDEADAVQGVFWSRDGTMLAIRMNRGPGTKVEFWRVDDQESISTWALNGETSHQDVSIEMAWSGNDSRVVIAAMGEADDNGTPAQQGHIYAVDVARGVTLLKHNLAGWEDGSRVTSVAWSPDDRTIVAGNRDGRIEAVDVESGRVRFSNRVSSTTICDLAYSPDGRRIVAGAGDGTVRVFNAAGGEDLLRFRLGGEARHTTWSPNGRRLAAATSDGEIHIWDADRAFEFSDLGSRSGELALAYYRSRQQSDPLEKHDRLREVLRLAPDALGYWALRGNAQAELGNLEQASHEFAKAIKPGLDRSFPVAIDYGYALIGAGETNAFREYCQSLLDEFADIESPSTGSHVAWVCAITENDLLDTKTLVRLCRADVTRSGKNWYALPPLGAALYRDQQYQQAAETLSDLADSLQARNDPSEAVRLAATLYFLAMTRQRLGDTRQAVRVLANADRISSDVESNGQWSDLVQVKVLKQQATEIIHGSFR